MIKLYTQKGCKPCREARSYLDKLEGVEYEEVNISGSTGNLVEFLNVCKTFNIPMSTPLLLDNDGRYIHGFESPNEYLELLRETPLDTEMSDLEDEIERSEQQNTKDNTSMFDVKNQEEATPEAVPETPQEEVAPAAAPADDAVAEPATTEEAGE